MQQTASVIPQEVIPLAQTMTQHPTFKTLVAAVRARTPGRSPTDAAPTTVAQQAFLRQGFEEALDLIETIAFEKAEEAAEIPAALDPRD